MVKDSHKTGKIPNFNRRLSAFIQKRHAEHTAKRVAQDLYRASGQNVPVGTVYKWISADTFPSAERLGGLLIAYPTLGAALYGDVVDRARQVRKERLEEIIAKADAELEGYAYA